jgi:ABC-type uncharacterized transport system permease subunit
MKLAFFILVVLAYALASLAFYWTLVRPKSGSLWSASWSRRVLLVAWVLHFADIAHRSAVLGTCPVASAQFGLSLAALAAVGSFLVWARTDKQLSLGVIVVPIGWALFVAAEFLANEATRAYVPGWFIAVHVTANLLSVGLFVVAAAAAAAYLVQSTRLKSKRATARNRVFLGLSSLESLSHGFLGLGLGLMTLGVVSGAVFAARLSHGDVGSLRVVLSYVSWLVATLVVIGQRVTGWRGRKVAWGTILSATLAVVVVVLYAVAAGGRP